ncbi:MAG: hypothetical protein V7723_10995 [Sneathiella sp.]|uniref:hypothetical protein n=1 Tax=Sneathiella sp. TaxID=1964365 RepID=UPI003001BEE5
MNMRSVDNIVIDIDLTTVQALVEKARDLLIALRNEYDLSAWEYTKNVRIAPYEFPHSHPILTINAQLVDGPAKDVEAFLSTYIHEQIHWALDDHRLSETKEAMQVFKETYPNFHKDFPTTAKDECSSYLHLIVNWLELKAMTELVGAERARNLMGRFHHYTKIYETVLCDFDEIQTVLEETSILPLPRPQ